MGESTRSRLVLFGGLYFAQGVPWGFVTIALVLRLTGMGMGAASIGKIVAVAQLPWIFKVVMAPFVDRWTPGHRRRALLLAVEAAMAVTLLLLSLVNPLARWTPFLALLLVHNVFAALQDVGTDALAVEILPTVERGRANGVMTAAKYAGVLVGGSGLAFLGKRLGWPATCLAAAALLLVPAALVAMMRRPEAAPVKASAPALTAGALLREILRSFALPVTALAALFALVSGATDSFLYPMLIPLLRRQIGLDENRVNGLVTLAALLNAVGALVGGWLADRLGRRRAIASAAIVLALAHVGFAATQSLWSRTPVLLAYQVTSALAAGALYSSTIALFMDLTNPRVAATHFQSYMALLNVRLFWAALAGGTLAERLPAPAMFAVAAGIELLPLLLLPFLDARRALFTRPR